MNILILNWRDPKNPKAGGAEIVTAKYAEAWSKAGHSVFWFTATFPGAKNVEIINGVNIIRKGGAYTLYLIAPFFYFFSGIKFDVIIDEIHGLPLFFTPIYIKKPKIAFIHEVAGDIWDFMYEFPINKLGKFMETFLLSFYKNVLFLTVSESTMKELQALGIKNVQIITNGLDLKSSHKYSKEKELTIIFVSRLVKMKGIEDVIDACAYINDKKNAHLWIVGEGNKQYTADLKKLIKEKNIENKVNFFNNVTDEKKLSLMGRAHLLLHASVKEGWGLVIGEAASQGTPAVVYNVGGLRDSVSHTKTGIIVAKNTPRQLAVSALELFENKKKYKLMQENAFKWSQSLNWDIAIKKSLLILTEINKNEK